MGAFVNRWIERRLHFPPAAAAADDAHTIPAICPQDRRAHLAHVGQAHDASFEAHGDCAGPEASAWETQLPPQATHRRALPCLTAAHEARCQLPWRWGSQLLRLRGARPSTERSQPCELHSTTTAASDQRCSLHCAQRLPPKA